MINKLKRIYSCLTVLVICLASNVGLPVKAVVPINHVNLIANKTIADEKDSSMVLYSGVEIMSEDTTKVAGHYSHRSHYSHSSHVSHQSHYSSRY